MAGGAGSGQGHNTHVQAASLNFLDASRDDAWDLGSCHGMEERGVREWVLPEVRVSEESLSPPALVSSASCPKRRSWPSIAAPPFVSRPGPCPTFAAAHVAHGHAKQAARVLKRNAEVNFPRRVGRQRDVLLTAIDEAAQRCLNGG